jgi:glycosyltransferase involved in cell wall biosynthesis
MRRVAFLCSNAASTGLFRGPLVADCVARGHRVYVFAPDYTPATKERISRLNAEPVDFRMDRTGANPVGELRVVLELTRLLRGLEIDTCLGFMTKLAIYGCIAGFFARVPDRYAMVEGLGYFFTRHGRRPNLRTAVIRRIIVLLYRVSLPLARRLFLLNPDDAVELAETGSLDSVEVSVLDSGIGIDTSEYRAAPPVEEPLTFLMVSRLLREKGVREYAAAAERLKRDHPSVRFVLVGPEDTNPGGIAKTEAQAWVERGLLEWPGAVADTRSWYESANVYVLPSYREGMPRTVLEAMAAGRPVITTDAPGCRETIAGCGTARQDNGVREGRNGFLVPVGSADALVAAMKRFVEDPALVARMGAESRRLAESRFDVRRANARILGEMNL